MCRYVCPYRVRKDTCQVDLALLCYAILLWRGCFVSLVCKSVQSVLAALDSINYIILVMSGCFVLRHKEKWPVIVQPQWEDALFYGMGGTTGITRESTVQEIKQIQKVKTETNWAGKTRVHSGHSFDGEHCCCESVPPLKFVFSHHQDMKLFKTNTLSTESVSHSKHQLINKSRPFITLSFYFLFVCLFPTTWYQHWYQHYTTGKCQREEIDKPSS